MPLLICLEGIPGSGKSTFAQRLCLHLQRAGYAARWHHEHDRNQPVIPVGTSDEWKPETRARHEAWRKFSAQTVRDQEIVILDGALFQKQINHFIKEQKLERIPAFYGEHWKALHKLRPLLIHFRHDDLGSHLQKTFKQRGVDARTELAGYIRPTKFGLKFTGSDQALLTHYFGEIQKQVIQISTDFPGEQIKLMIEDGRWDQAFNRVCTHLGLPRFKPATLPAGIVTQLAGTYRNVNGLEHIFVDRVSGGRGLRLRGDRSMQLIDAAALHFFVDNRQDEIRFETATGQNIRLRLGAWSMLGSGIYPRTQLDRFSIERVFDKIT